MLQETINAGSKYIPGLNVACYLNFAGGETLYMDAGAPWPGRGGGIGDWESIGGEGW